MNKHAALYIIVASITVFRPVLAEKRLDNSHAGKVIVGTDKRKASVEDLQELLASFESAKSLEKKEALLYRIEQNYPNAGGELFKLAVRTKDLNTKYKAIFELGQLKYREATPYLIQSLSDPENFVRANSARALGDMWTGAGAEDWKNKYPNLANELIALLRREKDGGTIEQTSLALQNIKAKEAVPAIKERLVKSSLGAQTKMWLLQAIGALGSRDDVPFLAGYLSDEKGKDSGSMVGMSAAQAIEAITGEDFGFPKHGGPFSPSLGVEKARKWWSANRGKF